MNVFLEFVSKFIPISVSAETLVDKREVILSNASVQDIEEGFQRVHSQLNVSALHSPNTNQRFLNDYSEIFR